MAVMPMLVEYKTSVSEFSPAALQSHLALALPLVRLDNVLIISGGILKLKVKLPQCLTKDDAMKMHSSLKTELKIDKYIKSEYVMRNVCTIKGDIHFTVFWIMTSCRHMVGY
jgi:hypothetical protein